MKTVIFCGLIIPLVFSTVAGDLKTLFEWKYIDYVWRDDSQKQEAINSGKYNATKIFAIDVDEAPDGSIFVTTPSQQGVPASLSTVSTKYGDGGPLLRPYPDWSWHSTGTSCTGITSVYRVTIDDCNRLWVLDTGKFGDDQICPAQLLAFDLLTSKLITKIVIPSRYAQNKTGQGLLITPVVETRGRRCRETWVYMADVEGAGLVIYNNEGLLRLEDTSFEADKQHANFTIVGESFSLEDGIFALTLRPKKCNTESSYLFYRPLASLKQYYVCTANLKQSFQNNIQPNYKKLDYTFPAQVSVEAFTIEGILFMAYTNPPAIACWNSYKAMNDENVVIVAANETTMQFSSGMKIRGNRLFVLTNRYQKIMRGSQNFGEVNYRILFERNVNELVRGTPCQ